MSTSHSSAHHTRGRSVPRAQQQQSHTPTSPLFDMDVNNHAFHRTHSQSPTRRSPYLRQERSPTASPPRSGSTALSRSGSTYSHHHHHPPPLSPSSLGDVKKLNRSSVLHLRNLSELTLNDDVVHGLGIPAIETEEVTGLAGRKRLARGESQKVYAGGKLWVDKQRQVIQTYEYLCHVGEAKQYARSIVLCEWGLMSVV